MPKDTQQSNQTKQPSDKSKADTVGNRESNLTEEARRKGGQHSQGGNQKQ